jgi:hypothetical protein
MCDRHLTSFLLQPNEKVKAVPASFDIADTMNPDGGHSLLNRLLGAFDMTRKEIQVLALACVLLPPMIYGCYWVAKHASYSLFYRDMVEQTVRDMVKDAALRGS